MSDLTARCCRCGTESDFLTAAWTKPDHGVRYTVLVCADNTECAGRCGAKYGENYGI